MIDWEQKARDLGYTSVRNMIDSLYARTRQERYEGKMGIRELAEYFGVWPGAIQRLMRKLEIRSAKPGTGKVSKIKKSVPYEKFGFKSSEEMFITWKYKDQLTYKEIQERLEQVGVALSLSTDFKRCKNGNI